MPSEAEVRSAQPQERHPKWDLQAAEWVPVPEREQARQADSKSPEAVRAAPRVGAQREEVGPGASTERLWAEPRGLKGWKDYPAGGEVH